MLRKLVVLVMCAGMLLPVLSSADDVAFLSPVLQELKQSAAGNRLERPSAGTGAPDAAFWVLFDFLQCSVLFHFEPRMEFAAPSLRRTWNSSPPPPRGPLAVRRLLSSNFQLIFE